MVERYSHSVKLPQEFRLVQLSTDSHEFPCECLRGEHVELKKAHQCAFITIVDDPLEKAVEAKIRSVIGGREGGKLKKLDNCRFLRIVPEYLEESFGIRRGPSRNQPLQFLGKDDGHHAAVLRKPHDLVQHGKYIADSNPV